MKLRLVAGSINAWPDTDGWRNFVLDISNRGVWDRDLRMTVQPDFVDDIANLARFRADTFDEVRAHHVLEHLSEQRSLLALGEFHRVLKPAGVLDLEIPDIARVCLAWVREELDDDGLRQWLYGEQLPNHETGDSHRYAWMEHELRSVLTDIGFDVPVREETGLALRVRAVKT